MTGRFETPPTRLPLNQKLLFSAVKRSGAVSPAMRAVARMIPVTMPARAARQETSVITLEVGAPSAAAASRRLDGTRRSMSSVVRTMTGIAMIASAMPPAQPE